MTDIVIPYKPRPQQKKLHQSLARMNVIVCHRRWGKTVFAINELIKRALTCKLKKPRTAYICPLHKQAKAVAWDYCKEFSASIPGVQFNEAELRVDYPNSGRLQLLGADNYHALRGIYLDAVCLDEYAQMSPAAWSEVIRPALSDRKGMALMIGTPLGHNQFYDIYQQAGELDGWHRELHKASETGLIDDEELDAARREMTEAEYAQEFECSWQAAIRGAYYGKEMSLADETGRIGRVPYDQAIPVITSWDLGVRDATAIWFWQVVGSEIRAIDYEEFTGLGLSDIVRSIKDKPYIYAQHIAPHDIEVTELGTGVSRKEVARNLGINFDVAPKLTLMDGINALRSKIGRMWFDEKNCGQGIEALKQYRTEYDDKHKVFRTTPLHDWSSHAADSARYFAVARWKGNNIKPKLDYTSVDRARGASKAARAMR